MAVCKWDMCWRNFRNFPLATKNVKSRSEIALFSNERHSEIWFPKKRTITFFWSKLSKLHKKDPILHMTTTEDLRGNPKPQDRTGPKPVRGRGTFLRIFLGRVGSGNFISSRSGSGNFISGWSESGYFLPGCETFSPGISGINLPFIPKLRK